jgi:hypothetical protein
MKRSGSKRTVAGATGDRSRALSSDADRPRFWDELTWFAILVLGGWILALAVLPPAMVRLREGLAFEARCRRRVEYLSDRYAALGQVVNAFETDSRYREEVIRKILGVKKRDEVFLK